METHKEKKIGFAIPVIRFNRRHDVIGCRVTDLKSAGFERLDENI